jgi:hypothetical protein
MASLVIIGEAGFFTAPNGHRGVTGNMLRTTFPNGFTSILVRDSPECRRDCLHF